MVTLMLALISFSKADAKSVFFSKSEHVKQNIINGRKTNTNNVTGTGTFRLESNFTTTFVMFGLRRVIRKYLYETDLKKHRIVRYQNMTDFD